MAAAAIHGLINRLTRCCGSAWRTSLASTAAVLVGYPTDPSAETLAPEQTSDFIQTLELTNWGPARRLKPPVSIEGVPIRWERPAGPLGVADAEFSDTEKSEVISARMRCGISRCFRLGICQCADEKMQTFAFFVHPQTYPRRIAVSVYCSRNKSSQGCAGLKNDPERRHERRPPYNLV
jgi:hypothetical protein